MQVFESSRYMDQLRPSLEAQALLQLPLRRAFQTCVAKRPEMPRKIPFGPFVRWHRHVPPSSLNDHHDINLGVRQARWYCKGKRPVRARPCLCWERHHESISLSPKMGKGTLVLEKPLRAYRAPLRARKSGDPTKLPNF